MDLDPGEGVDWTATIAPAEEIRDRLKAAGLAAFVKTSGGKGLHVVAPVTPKAGLDGGQGLRRRDGQCDGEPTLPTASSRPSRRRSGEGRILIDYLRNQPRQRPRSPPYATRARPGAAVSMPLDWDDLGARDRSGVFHHRQRSVANFLVR